MTFKMRDAPTLNSAIMRFYGQRVCDVPAIINMFKQAFVGDLKDVVEKLVT